MMLLKIWNYFRGYIIILVEGYFIEKFINICIHRQIFLWDIKKQKNRSVILKVSIEGFKLLRSIAKKAGCKVKIVDKKGLPFKINMYKKRKAFVIGAVVFIFLFYGMSSFIWSIEIYGNKKIDNQVILSRLEAEGIKPGIIRYIVDTNKITYDLIMSIKELAWVSVSIKGTKLKIEVAEMKDKPEIVYKDVLCNIVAAKDGVIKSILVKSGQEKVKIGDTVKKGDVLISGEVEIKNQNDKSVHAIGEVKARTWYEKNNKVNMVTINKEKTQRKKDNYSLILFNRQINLFHGNIEFENYDKTKMVKKLELGEDFVFPFEIMIERYCENKIITKNLNFEDAKNVALNNALSELLNELPENVQKVFTKTDFITRDDGQLYANVIIECLEDIGVEEKMLEDSF